MDTNKKTLKIGLFLISIFLIASACNLVSNMVNPVDDVISEVENIATQVDVEDLENLGEEIQTAIPEIPTDLGDLQATAESFQEDFTSGEVPSDVPIVEGETKDFFSSDTFVSYTTTMDFEDVLAFYKEELPNNGWEADEMGAFEIEGTALLSYSKDDQIILVTISTEASDGVTTVLITLQPK